MIIRIMGTSGSGKTMVVQRLMQATTVVDYHDTTIRKLPMGHVLGGLLGGNTFLFGYYHDGVGGCDNLPPAWRDRAAFFDRLLPEFAERWLHVLYEGVVFGDEVTRTVALSKTTPHEIIYLTTPLDECLTSVATRRAAQGKPQEFNESQTRKRHQQLQNVAHRLRDAGVTVHKLDREAAFQHLKRELGL